jgi:hypothetical protein
MNRGGRRGRRLSGARRARRRRPRGASTSLPEDAIEERGEVGAVRRGACPCPSDPRRRSIEHGR